MVKINEFITKHANEEGLTGGDIAGRKASYVANRTALSTVTKDLAAITPFKDLLDLNIQIAIELGNKIAADKTNAAIINRPLIWLKNNASDRPDIAEYLAQLHFVSVEGARVLTQPRLVGPLTDTAVEQMKSVLGPSMTVASSTRVMERVKTDGDNRINRMIAQQSRTLADIKGTSPRTRTTDKTGVDTSNPLLQ
jgi:hypothetical protein